jgi:hypothetical protein
MAKNQIAKSKKIISIFLIALVGLEILATEAKAEQKFKYNQEVRYEGYISGKEPNRVMIEGDRVKEIIGVDSEYYDVTSDVNTGQVFIRAEKGVKEPLFMTLITEKGRTQDFKLIAKTDTKGQIIVAEMPRSEKILLKGAKHEMHEAVVEIITNLDRAELKNQGELECGNRDDGVKSGLIKEEQIGEYEIDVWGIKNCGMKQVNLLEKSFADSRTIAVAIEDGELAANKSTIIYKISQIK